MPTISSGDNCIQSVGPEKSTAAASVSFGVDLIAAAVSPPRPIAASSTNASATVRRVTFTIRPRSINGTRISDSTARPGRTTEPTTSSGPLNSFSDWNRRSEEHTSELQSLRHLVCRLLLEKKKNKQYRDTQDARLSTSNVHLIETRCE